MADCLYKINLSLIDIINYWRYIPID